MTNLQTGPYHIDTLNAVNAIVMHRVKVHGLHLWRDFSAAKQTKQK